MTRPPEDHTLPIALLAVFVMHSPFAVWWSALTLPWYAIFGPWLALIALVGWNQRRLRR